MAWVREWTIPTERPPLAGEASAKFADRGVPRGQRDGSLRPYSRLSRPVYECRNKQQIDYFSTSNFRTTSKIGSFDSSSTIASFFIDFQLKHSL
jgi:hypothetical protein